MFYGINYIQINETNLEEVISNLETPAFGFEKKLVVIKNSGLFQKEGKRVNATLKEIKEKIVSYFTQNIEEIKQYNIVIFIEDSAEKNKFFTFLEKQGKICAFEKQTPSQIIARLKAIYTAYQVKVEDSTLKYLIESCGTGMQELINESRKLIEYAGKDGTVQKEDVDLLCMKEVNAVIFTLTDSLGQKNITEALQTLHNLIYNKEPLQKIVITLYNHFKKLYLTTLALEEKKDVVAVLNLKPNQIFLVSKYKKQANYFEKQELRNILEELILLDKNSKIGLIDLQIGLEAILSKYCS